MTTALKGLILMVSLKKNEPALAGNTSTGMLKLLALAFMFIDHAGKMCFPLVPEMRILGRLAFPLYCWCLVVGACHTRSMPKYLLRLAVIGVVSQPVYMVALNHPWSVPNIFLTLLIGLMGIWGMQKKKWGSHIWGPVLALLAAHVLRCGSASYGWKGVLLMLLLYAVRDSRRGIAAMMIAFCLFWGSSSAAVTSIFGLPLSPITRSAVGSVISPFLRLQGLALLALPLIIWPDEVRLPVPSFLRSEGDERTHVTLRTRMPRVPMPKWLGYAIYPLHLALLIGLEHLMRLPVHWEQLSNAWGDLTGFVTQLLPML